MGHYMRISYDVGLIKVRAWGCGYSKRITDILICSAHIMPYAACKWFVISRLFLANENHSIPHHIAINSKAPNSALPPTKPAPNTPQHQPIHYTHYVLNSFTHRGNRATKWGWGCLVPRQVDLVIRETVYAAWYAKFQAPRRGKWILFPRF